MAISKELLEILVCPVDKADLEVKQNPDGLINRVNVFIKRLGN